MSEASVSGYAHGFLRSAYSLMAVFVDGFVSIVSLDILLFLFIVLPFCSTAAPTNKNH